MMKTMAMLVQATYTPVTTERLFSQYGLDYSTDDCDVASLHVSTWEADEVTVTVVRWETNSGEVTVHFDVFRDSLDDDSFESYTFAGGVVS